MTENQRKFFFMPEWNRTCAIHGWKNSLRGMDLLRMRRGDWGIGEPAELYQKLWTLAVQLAEASDVELTVDVLRYAATLMATSDKARGFHSPQTSCKKLNNAEANHAVALFRVLREPDSVKWLTEWLNPDLANRRGLIDQLLKWEHEAKILAMARTIHGVNDLEDLTESQLRWYIMEFKQRAGTWLRQKSGRALAAKRPTHSHRRQYANVEEPF